VHARDPVAAAAHADVQERSATHLEALLGDDARAVRQAVPHEVRAERSVRRAGRGILRDALPWRVHPPVHGGTRLNGLSGEDVGGLGEPARRGTLHRIERLHRDEHEPVAAGPDLDRQGRLEIGGVERDTRSDRVAVGDGLERRQWLLHLGEAVAHRDLKRPDPLLEPERRVARVREHERGADRGWPANGSSRAGVKIRSL